MIPDHKLMRTELKVKRDRQPFCQKIAFVLKTKTAKANACLQNKSKTNLLFEDESHNKITVNVVIFNLKNI